MAKRASKLLWLLIALFILSPVMILHPKISATLAGIIIFWLIIKRYNLPQNKIPPETTNPKSGAIKEQADLCEFVPQIIANYDHITEFEISNMDNQLFETAPFIAERGLLYALRISLCLPQIKNLNILASRYNTTCAGAGGMGLLASKRSHSYQLTYDFLAKKYLEKFVKLADNIFQDAKTAAENRKTKQAKITVFNKAKNKIKDSKTAFECKLPDLDSAVEALENQICEEIESINACVKL